jgi:hypothetical protein
MRTSFRVGSDSRMPRYNANFWQSITLPHLPDNPSYYEQVDSIWNNITEKYMKGRWNVASTIAFQPFPRTIGAASEARGGNAMGLSSKDHDRFIVEIAGIYTSAADDAAIQKMSQEYTEVLTRDLGKIRTNSRARGITVGEYNPAFMNDAGPDQDVMGSYRDVDKFAALQKELDPVGLWAKRAGGFKFGLRRVVSSANATSSAGKF